MPQNKCFLFLHPTSNEAEIILIPAVLHPGAFTLKAMVWIPRNRISVSIKGCTRHLFYSSFQTTLGNTYSNSYSHWQRKRCPFPQYSQLWMLWIVSNFANWVDKNWHLVNFTSVSLTAVRRSFFSDTLATCISSSVSRIFISFAHFYIGMFAFSYQISNIYQIVNFCGYRNYQWFLLSSINFD